MGSVDDLNQFEIIDAYRKGKSLNDLSFEYEVSIGIIRRLLDKFHIPRRRGDHVCPSFTRTSRWSGELEIVRSHKKTWKYGTRRYRGNQVVTWPLYVTDAELKRALNLPEKS